MDSFDLDHIEAEGYLAGEHGAKREYNPWPAGGAEWHAWNRGWDEAWDDYAQGYSEGGMWQLDHIIALLMVIVVLFALAGGVYQFIVWCVGGLNG